MGARTALVTGGAKGIGLGIARALAERGFSLALCGRSVPENIESLKKDIAGGKGTKIVFYKCDVSDEAERTAMLSALKSDFGTPDVLVNNAGVAPLVRADLLEMSVESFERVMRINLEGPFFLTQAVASRMKERKDAAAFRCIVNICSISADYASINRGEYCMSKAAVSMATKLWAVRLAEFGIAVYEVRPGIIRTDMTKTVREKYDGLIAEGILLQPRWGEPDDVGRAVASLADGNFAYSTGQVVNVDGGMTVLRM